MKRHPEEVILLFSRFTFRTRMRVVEYKWHATAARTYHRCNNGATQPNTTNGTKITFTCFMSSATGRYLFQMKPMRTVAHPNAAR